jgi:hypothetical protein
VFYESLLPHLVGESELDRVSTAGYAMGYVGGGVLLAINVLMMSQPAWFGLPDRGAACARAWPAWRCGGWSSRSRCSAGAGAGARVERTSGRGTRC